VVKRHVGVDRGVVTTGVTGGTVTVGSVSVAA
jgi:hypothetical protein